jgi:tRNA threonylcarbamoyladenosine biosynthesis protein TsaB
MKVLAVDTTSARESVALADGDVVLAEVRLRTVDGHSRRLLPAIAFVLESAGVAPRDVEGYAVTVGPGSFTGVRVGLSTVQGLALAGGRPCLGLSTLDVLAEAVRGEAPTLVPMVDASRSGQVFAALYDAEARPLEDPQAVAPEAVAERVAGPAAFVGDGAERFRDQILARRPDARLPRRSLYLARTLAAMAVPRLGAGEGTSPAALRPLYLRAADIRPSATATSPGPR